MLLVIIKLTLTPLLMGGVIYASRRWGSSVGGLLAGLPITAGPISIYLAIEQGSAFAATAALGSLAGIGAVTSSYLAYVEISRRFKPVPSITAAVLAYALVMIAALLLRPNLPAILAYDGLLVAAVFARARRKAEKLRSATPPPWDVPARLLTSTAMVIAVTLGARLIGPGYSGLFSTIPAIAWPLIVFAHQQEGREQAIVVVLGVLKGTLGLVAFYLIVYAMLPTHSLASTSITGLLVAVSLTSIWLFPGRPRRAEP